MADLQARIARTETELQLERDKYYKIKRDMTETRTNSTTYEAHAQALQLQVTELQVSFFSTAVPLGYGYAVVVNAQHLCLWTIYGKLIMCGLVNS